MRHRPEDGGAAAASDEDGSGDSTDGDGGRAGFASPPQPATHPWESAPRGGYAAAPTDGRAPPPRRAAARWIVALLLLLGALLGLRLLRGAAQRASSPGGARHAYPAGCAASIAVWSRGLMRACCDVRPAAFYKLLARAGGLGKGEHSTIDWATVPIRDRAIVYVPALDMPAFLRRFAQLPPSARLTLVSGGEDVGVPRELWGLGARGARKWMTVPMPLSLPAFLADPRLLHWHVQNLDLRGCNAFSGCAHDKQGAPAAHARKVSALPIGLDLHTYAEKRPRPGEHWRNSPACAQQATLEAIRARLPPFAARPDALLAPFACARPDRRPTCEALEYAAPRPRATFFQGDRAAMWAAMGAHAFVAAPIGHGIDTHRAWEALALGSVPVVLASSLDELYAPFPVVTIARWADANASAMGAWRARLVARFGADPFSRPDVVAGLTTAHWAAAIAARHDAAVGRNAGAGPWPLLPSARPDPTAPNRSAVAASLVRPARRRRRR